jgi:signal peptidase II
MNKGTFVALVSISVLTLDQLTKEWVRRAVPPNDSIELVHGLLSITHARNVGGAFSLFAGADDVIRVPFFLLAGAFAIAVLIYFVYQIPSDQRRLLFAVAGVLGGALGNLTDRVLRGHVTDFAHVYVGSWSWPAFNVADSFITIGVVILIGHSMFSHEGTEQPT